MSKEVKVNLEGSFKVDIYSGKNFINSTDWFHNFITATGLFFPAIYPFADCFRFLSIGTDTSTANSGAVVTGAGGSIIGSGLGTTGLAAPIHIFNTNLGPQTGIYIGWQGYENGTDNSQSACGTLLTEQGPRLYRAWAIPTGGVNCTVAGGLTINEFMVSPSSGSDPSGCCAFSRVRRTVTIPNGYNAIISYQLSINIQNTGLTFFNSNTFTTNNADITSSPDDAALVQSWGNLSGYYRQVYHGLTVIDSLGAHFVPQYGCGMEPYLSDLSDYAFYISPDNAAFDIAQTGSVQSSPSGAYLADGLMGFLDGLPMTFQNTSTPSDALFYGIVPNAQNVSPNIAITTPRNIRLGNGSNNTPLPTPSLTNYSIQETFNNNSSFDYQSSNDSSQYDISYGTPGILGLNSNEVNFKQSAIFSTRIFKQPLDLTGGYPQNLITGRKKTITRKTLFSPVSSLGYNTRFGSLVFAFGTDKGQSDNIYYPMIDTLFFDSSGRSLMQHYRLIEIVLDNRGTGVADAYISITPSGQNTNRFYSRKTYQGPYDIIDGNPSGFDLNNSLMQGGNNPAQTQSNNYVDYPLSGFSDVNNISGEGLQLLKNRSSLLVNSGCSGWGMVYGVVADDNFYNSPYDCGLVNHNVTGGLAGLSVTPAPNDTGTQLYWPDINTTLSLSITGVKYFSTGACFNGIAFALTSGQSGYNWSTNLCKFCPPIGHILHHEHIDVSGYRLLPNYGIPNNSNINIYAPQTGGQLPGTSFDNGIEYFQTITWSASCSDAINCLPPV